MPQQHSVQLIDMRSRAPEPIKRIRIRRTRVLNSTEGKENHHAQTGRGPKRDRVPDIVTNKIARYTHELGNRDVITALQKRNNVIQEIENILNTYVVETNQFARHLIRSAKDNNFNFRRWHSAVESYLSQEGADDEDINEMIGDLRSIWQIIITNKDVLGN